MKTVGNSYYLTANKVDLGSCKKMIKDYFLDDDHPLIIDIGANNSEGNLWYPFSFVESGKEYQGRFYFYEGNTASDNPSGVYFDIEVLYEKDKMSAVSAFSKKLTALSGYKKEFFYLTSLNDGVSEYFREIGYKHAAKYEKKLRELLLVIFAPKNGKKWVDQVSHLSSTLKPDQKIMIERGLEQLDLSQLEEIFFGKTVNELMEEYEKLFDMKNLNTYSVRELRSMIRENRPKSIWEQYIEQYISISDMTSRMNTIRSQRNKIAHVKYFSFDAYSKFRRDVRYVTQKVDEAITEIKSEKTKINVSKMLESIGLLVKTITDNFTAVREISFDAIASFQNGLSGVDALKSAVSNGTNIWTKSLE